MSRFGHWTTGEQGLPAFVYTADHRLDPAAEWDRRTAPPTRRHWIMIGNRRLQLHVANDGTVGVWDGADGHRWLTAPDPEGTGVSVVSVDGGPAAGTDAGHWPPGAVPAREFAPTSFTVRMTHDGVAVERTVLCPEGEDPFVLVRVRLRAVEAQPDGRPSAHPSGEDGRGTRRVHLREVWALRPLFVSLGRWGETRRADAERAVRYQSVTGPGRIVALETRLAPPTGTDSGDGGADAVGRADRARALAATDAFGGVDDPGAGMPTPAVFGRPRALALVDPTGSAIPLVRAADHPVLELALDLLLPPDGTLECWFRFGLATDEDLARAGRAGDGRAADGRAADGRAADGRAADGRAGDARAADGRAEAGRPIGAGAPDSYPLAAALSAARLAERLPSADSPRLPEAARELPWHAALLTGGACRDEVLGGHTLDQGSAYAFEIGMNGAARDPLQHALPLVYLEPDLALSVLRNTCAWATPDGDLPYALDSAKKPWTQLFTPSDQNLYALWLATEYLAATGDTAAFTALAPYHPSYGVEPVPLGEHLARQQRYLLEEIGRGERGHLRIRNADWNDSVLVDAGVPRELMIEKGESVLNSAFGSWVLARWAGAAGRIGLPGAPAVAAAAAAAADELRAAVAEAWTGRWFARAYTPGAATVGEDDCWLEVQPWAILCGAADPARAADLLRTIDRFGRAGSPLGARLRFGPGPGAPSRSHAALGDQADVWFAVNAVLVWAAAAVAPDLAADEWRRMTLASHARQYPHVWEGTLSGPDAYNGPASARPGRTWSIPGAGIGMQAFPVANLHSHAQPLLAYLRLLGVAPEVDGSLAVGGPAAAGASFRSRTLQVDADGHGLLRGAGPVTVRSPHGLVQGTGEVRW